MANAEVTRQFDVVWDMSEDELYEHLGMASLGTESVDESVDSMRMLRSLAASTDAAEIAQSFESFLKKGKKKFKELWDGGIKDVACEVYRGGHAIGDAKDLGAYIVGILISAAKISNPLATIAVAIAIKKGLDKLCPAK